MLRQHNRSFLASQVLFDTFLISFIWHFSFKQAELAETSQVWNLNLFGGLYFFSLVLLISGFAKFGIYHSFRATEGLGDLFPIVGSFVTYLILTNLGLFVFSERKNPAQFLLIFSASGMVGMIFFRMLLRQFLKKLRSKGFNLRHILIVGDGRNAQEFARRIRRCRWMGFHIVGFLSESNYETDKHFWGIPVVGSITDLEDVLKEKQIDQVYCALSFDKIGLAKGISEKLEKSTADFRIVPDLAELSTLNTSFYMMDGIPVLGIRESPLQGINLIQKRIFDIVFSFTVLVVSLPMTLLIAFIIKTSSKGPIFFKQKRIGYDGREFSIIKFRSMPVDVEQASGPIWAEKNDGRATGFGSFLRKTSLDEWPQFFNVLMGSMSVVGPRPERPEFIVQFKEDIPRYMLRHKMKAGITGWAQVNGWRGRTSLTKRIQYDLHYIDNWSIWFDLKIILVTIIKGFIHKNAY